MNKRFDVTIQENCKYNPATFTVGVTCPDSESAKNIIHAQYKNMKKSDATLGFGYVYGDKITIMDVKEIKKDEVA